MKPRCGKCNTILSRVELDDDQKVMREILVSDGWIIENYRVMCKRCRK